MELPALITTAASSQTTELGVPVEITADGTTPPTTVSVTMLLILVQVTPLKVLFTKRLYSVVVETAEGVKVAF